MMAKRIGVDTRTDLEVAVIGDFQIGKSTFVNCLVGRNVAKIGIGISTTHKVASYAISNGLAVVDTPGFNAPEKIGKEDEREAREAIRRSFVVIVYLIGPMDEFCRSQVKDILLQGKRIVFVYNCMNRDRWSPEESDDIRRAIEADVETLGYGTSVVMLGGRKVHPINAQWALFGLGLLHGEKEKRKIRSYAYDQLELSRDVDLKDEILRRSNITDVRNYIQGLPLEVLSDFLKDRDRQIRSIENRFFEEFAKRIANKECS